MFALNQGSPKLSIIIPNYNHGALLGGILSDIGSQDDVACEVIIVDDGSTDNSIAIVETWQKRYNNIRLVKNEKNCGVVYSLNRAIAASVGEYLAFPSADNRIAKSLYRKSIQLLDENPSSALCFSSPAQFDGESGMVSEVDLKISKKACYFSPSQLVALGRKRISVGNMSHTIVVRKKMFDECKVGSEYFSSELGPYCDFFAWNLLAFRHGACFIPESLAFFRVDRHSYSARHRDTTKATEALLDVLISSRCLDVRDQFKDSTVLLSVGWSCFKYISKKPKYRCLMGSRYLLVSLAMKVKATISKGFINANG